MTAKLPQKDLLELLDGVSARLPEDALGNILKACALEIRVLQKHIDAMSCCCAGCTKHNQQLGEANAAND